MAASQCSFHPPCRKTADDNLFALIIAVIAMLRYAWYLPKTDMVSVFAILSC